MLRRLLCSDSSNPKVKQLPTREAILRDKSLARLGLHALEQFPKPVLVEIAQVNASLRALLYDCKNACFLNETAKKQLPCLT